jgi:hypothetical protein
MKGLLVDTDAGSLLNLQGGAEPVADPDGLVIQFLPNSPTLWERADTRAALRR